NVMVDVELLAPGGSIAAYASGAPAPAIPFWPLVFKNARIYFLGSDDFPPAAKVEAAAVLDATLAAGWPGLPIAARFPLAAIAAAHEHLEQRHENGRVVLTVASATADDG